MVGNGCQSGWKECIPEACGGLDAECSKHTDCQTFPDLFCNNGKCAYGDQRPTKAPTHTPTKAPTNAPTHSPTRAPSPSPTLIATTTTNETPTSYPTGFLPVYSPFTYVSQCSTPLCKGGLCLLKDYEDDCSADEECFSNICNAIVKKCDNVREASLGALCYANYQSLIDNCKDGTCQLQGYGGSCRFKSECIDDFLCNRSVNKCDEFEKGEIGARCNLDQHCNDSGLYVGKCNNLGLCTQGRKIDGANCINRNECVSNMCNFLLRE